MKLSLVFSEDEVKDVAELIAKAIAKLDKN